MAREYEVEVFGQPSLYKASERKFKIYFSEPDYGINNLTGINLLINGYGAHPKSNVYKKMRNEFADKYNLVVLQCEYFGIEFMQTDSEIAYNELREKENEFIRIQYDSNEYYMKIIDKYQNETLENMNDMGAIQAIDNLTALKVVMDILKSNSFNFNRNKIIVYGHSHGAYLGHLCNLFAPNIFSALIDNSAYVYPTYLDDHNKRKTVRNLGGLLIMERYSYLISKVVFDKEFYNLDNLYSQVDNKCNIICFQGIDDGLYDYKNKIKFIKNIKNAEAELITSENLDNEVFKNTIHGVGADFIKMFEYVDNKYELENHNPNWGFTDIFYTTSKYEYMINNSGGVPRLNVNKIIDEK
ncbi:DUF2920 family protein [Clostridium neonatale]|uniref:DUF2920 family protein n=1 Tax=Clostridium neonatale TaxID=137838 RepID=UPI00291BB5BB|nr:conserved hypothetical protein [Clostridium neonatale]CAI3551847.1 conserved hypothetical protein [Clostridium neonatale]CAI3567110.1 conserved hypothetical protein [Clostridium neonatale]CAI3640486.1 conserved hypothetical protein [Clostridium neonatale]CAI3647967.1 conserved hypothetical protein [Clostridium neonatale]